MEPLVCSISSMGRLKKWWLKGRKLWVLIEEEPTNEKKENTANEADEKEPEDKEMTLKEYQKVLEEKRKALEALKTEERKVEVDKELAVMQQLSNKKTNDDIFVKLRTDKDKRKETVDKEEKAKKSLSINAFLKPASGEKYFNPGGLGQGRGARGGDDECCNSYDEVREAYRRKSWVVSLYQCKREGFAQKIKDKEGEGCNIYGSVEVNKVAGNFYLIKSFHQSSIFIPDLLAFQEDSYNVSRKPITFGEAAAPLGVYVSLQVKVMAHISKVSFNSYQFPQKVNP
ncbi:hypothetical protein L1887_38597 [Cichorium endivia]|nr:hypothetical protein L1887_38597 [Cichorium endivia]